MNLSEHFTLAELTRTRHPYANAPGPEELANLRRLCAELLEPLRARFGPIHVTSGFRAPKVNAAAGGVRASYHRRGLAADCILVARPAPADVFRWLLRAGPEFDQAIVYADGRLHLGLRERERPGRLQLLTKNAAGATAPWAPPRGIWAIGGRVA